MSRIGRMPIAIPAGVTVTIGDNNKVTDFIIEPQNGETPLKLYNQVKACAQFTPEFAFDIFARFPYQLSRAKEPHWDDYD